MPKHDYIFVDESGDPGFTTDQMTGQLLSSEYYTAAALHVCDDAFRDINKHVADFRYYSGLFKELKIPPTQPEFARLLGPIRTLAQGGKNIWASAIYVDKQNYNGSYLKQGGKRPQNPVKFRNYMLRCLLEHHFQSCPLQSKQYDLVLDRVELTKEEAENLQWYLAGNYNITTPTHITHAASIYVEGLQIVHHIANGFKNVVGGAQPPDELSFVNARDVTTDQYIYVYE